MATRWLGLGTRFLLACGLVVIASSSASLWALASLTRLSGFVRETVHDSDDAAAAASKVADALEREDDALLFSLAGDKRSRGALVEERQRVDAGMHALLGLLDRRPEKETTLRLLSSIHAYRLAVDGVLDGVGRKDKLREYHQGPNQLLRRAVGNVNAIRESLYREAQHFPAQAQGEVTRATKAVLIISIAALILSCMVALMIARSVVSPLRHITRSVDAVREGRFDELLPIDFRDELGDLAEAFNDMAARLSEFRRMNLGEVVRAKSALEATLQALPDAVILFDSSGVVLSLNAAAHELLGRLGPLPTRMQTISLPGFDTGVIERFLAGRTSATGPDLSGALKLESGSKLMRVLPRLLPVPGPDGSRPGGILVLYDVTELAQLDDRRGELVAVASHELRTPITTLHMTLLMLQEPGRSLGTHEKQLIETALFGAKQLLEIVDEYLDLTRLEAGQLRLQWSTLSVPLLVNQAVDRARALSVESGAQVLCVCGPDLPPVWGDPSRLRLVLDNVLSNAVKYTPPGGQVHASVSWASTSQGVRVVVSDSGPGIPEEFRERVFDKFFRIEHQRSGGERGVRGAGIGLYLARQIVERHRGTIVCGDASGAGGGTSITIELPVDGRPIASSAER